MLVVRLPSRACSCAVLLLWAAGGAAQGQVSSRPGTASQPAASAGPVVLSAEALRIHRSGLLIDGHNDLPWQIRALAGGSFDNLDISQLQPRLQTDIPRLRAGGVGAQFWAVFVPSETPNPRRLALEQFELIHRMVRRYPETFALARSADDIVRIHREGRIACLIGVEGGHMLENSLETLREFYDLGARYLTLTHTQTNDWADSATDQPRHGGLAPFGEQVVREMNRLGMLVDISHVSFETMRDVLRISRAPVIASHSGAYAVAAHVRNLPDDVLRLIARNGGVVMVVFFSGYCHPEAARVLSEMSAARRELRARYPDESEFRQA